MIKIYVGAGTCGLGAGAGAIIEEVKKYISNKNLDAELIEVGCIGYCAKEPILDVELPNKNRISYGTVHPKLVEKILDTTIGGEVFTSNVLFQFDNGKEKWPNVPFINEHPYFKYQTRLVLENCGIIDPESIDDYIARGGYKAIEKVLKKYKSTDVISEVKESGLRGRGGGGFPTGLKWEIASRYQADKKYIICNADEGDPGAFMDRAVIEGDPHRVIEGMLIGAYALGADEGYVYIRAEYPLAIKRLRKAIDDAKKKGFLGKNIFGTDFSFELHIKEGAGAFVCGEETALIASIEGRRGMPRPRPPYPAEKGLFGKPTVINNVETWANVSTIINKGAKYFASLGTEKSKGTKVFAISGKVKNTGLIEVEMGIKLRDIVYNIAGGMIKDKEFKAAQIGGPSGGCIPKSHLDVSIDYESLKELGAIMGSGGLVIMDEDTCMVDVAKFFMEFITRESCGKCTPCREGTYQMLQMLKSITEGNATEKTIKTLENLALVVKDASLCGLGQTAPNPVLSTMRWFKDEYYEHVNQHHCRAHVCKTMMAYWIDPEKCTGCTLCERVCPVNTIIGALKKPHTIITDNCIKCGACYEVCNFGAVIKVDSDYKGLVYKKDLEGLNA